MKTEVTPFLYPMDKKMISLILNGALEKCPGLCTIFFKTSTVMVFKVYALSRSYLDCFIFFPFYAQTVLYGLKTKHISYTVFIMNGGKV